MDVGIDEENEREEIFVWFLEAGGVEFEQETDGEGKETVTTGDNGIPKEDGGGEKEEDFFVGFAGVVLEN